MKVLSRIKTILNGNFFLLFIIPALFAFFLVFNKPAYQQQYSGDYDLKVVPLALQYVGKYYVDDSKVDPGEMLKAGLNKMENSSDEILVEFTTKNSVKDFNVQVNNNLREYRDVDVYDLQDVRDTFQDVFSFAVPLLTNDELDTNDLEYAVVDSMLKTLDPHSGMIVPEVYKEFMIETEGSFGGLGIVIGIRDGELTVISPIEGTPADKAGIKPNDKIVQIENESTINMSLVEAVGKLRGEKGTDVTIYIERKTFNEPRKFTITRDTIKIQSVEHFALEDDLLYIRIRDFQKNTLDGLVQALNENENTRGVILDLRGNPGGLLDQAEKVSDFFLESGIVVTTKVGNSKKSYKAKDAIPQYEGEVVVLVDSGSASASEIVAGALKNNNRAVVIGEKTFGKGSVQQIFDLRDGSAIKLTIADYLTPGDISIQDVGITPDIELERTVITKDKILFLGDDEQNGRIASVRKSNGDKPVYTIKYLDTSEDTEDGEQKPEEALTDKEKLSKLRDDFAIEVAKEVLDSSHNVKRKKSLNEISNILADLEKTQEGKIVEKWKSIGIDWSAGKNGKKKEAVIDVRVSPDNIKFKADETGTITFSATNKGPDTIYRLLAVTESDNSALDGVEIPFGRLAPGQTKSWQAKFDIPAWTYSRNDEVQLVFKSPSDLNIPGHSFEVTTTGTQKPRFAYNYEVIDDGRLDTEGDGDSRLEKGETGAIFFKLRNVGKGVSENTVVNLKNLSGDSIFLDKGRVEFKDFKPGTTRSGNFHFKINKEEEEIDFELQLIEEKFRDVQVIDITIPGSSGDEDFEKTENHAVMLGDETPVRGGSYSKAPVLGTASKDTSFKSVLKNEKWVKVRHGELEHGWIEMDQVLMSGNGSNSGKFKDAYNNPPVLTLREPPMVTKGNTILIRGKAFDRDTMENISLFKGDDKIGLIAPNEKEYEFSFRVELDKGINVLNVVGKDSTGLYTRETIAVRRITAQ